MAKVEIKEDKDLKEPELEVSQIWKHEESSQLYVLSQIMNHYVLICIQDGRHWVEIENDILDAFGGDFHDFVYFRGKAEISNKKTNESH